MIAVMLVMKWRVGCVGQSVPALPALPAWLVG